MAKKKGEIQLQREIETQEEWEEVMAMEGLWVIDVYQEWCGPCQALVGSFRRLKNEMGDSLLNFAIAKADTIDALEKYRGRCEPTFLFFAGGILTSYIHGANAPRVQKIITEQLASEHRILEGTGERREARDPVITRAQEIENERLAEELALKLAEGDKGITLAIIKPDVVAQGKAGDIIAEILEAGMEILVKDEREITFDEATELYSNFENEPYYDELIRFIISGPSHIMVLTRGESGATVVKDWKSMMGPASVEQAQEEAPTSLRARYGEKGVMNAVHGSYTKEDALREVALFFPNFTVPTYQKKKENIQRTLALIRPEAYATKKNAILQAITDAGFKIIMSKEVHLTKEQAAEFYKEHEQYAYFDSLVDTQSSGPLLALGLSGDDAIKAFRNALGPSNIDDAIEKAPKSLRAMFPGTGGMNQLHGSDSEEAAKEELAYFFPMEQTVAVIKPDAMKVQGEIIAQILESGFKIAAQQETVIMPEVVEVLYPNHQDKSYYEDLVTFLTSGPVLFLVLSREGAINGWRLEMGDIDPEVARSKQPHSIRALFGSTILRNAVHGSSNLAHVKEEMRSIFGALKFNEDGTVKGAQPDLDETAQVFERDRSFDAGGASPEHSNPEPEGDVNDTAQDVTAEDAQHDLPKKKTLNDEDAEMQDAAAARQAESEEGDVQSDRLPDVSTADDNTSDHAQEGEQEQTSEECPAGEDDQEADDSHKSHGSEPGSQRMETVHQEEDYQGDTDRKDHKEEEEPPAEDNAADESQA